MKKDCCSTSYFLSARDLFLRLDITLMSPNAFIIKRKRRDYFDFPVIFTFVLTKSFLELFLNKPHNKTILTIVKEFNVLELNENWRSSLLSLMAS